MVPLPIYTVNSVEMWYVLNISVKNENTKLRISLSRSVMIARINSFKTDT